MRSGVIDVPDFIRMRGERQCGAQKRARYDRHSTRIELIGEFVRHDTLPFGWHVTSVVTVMTLQRSAIAVGERPHRRSVIFPTVRCGLCSLVACADLDAPPLATRAPKPSSLPVLAKEPHTHVLVYFGP